MMSAPSAAAASLGHTVRQFVQRSHNARNLLLRPAASSSFDFARIQPLLRAHGYNSQRLSTVSELQEATKALNDMGKTVAIVEERDEERLFDAHNETAANIPVFRTGEASVMDVLQALLGYPGALEESSEPGSLGFANHRIPSAHIFFETALSFAFVNIKPVLPGHVLVCPRRRVASFLDLYPDEASDLMQAAQKVARVVGEAHHGASSFTLSLQDGPAAGQTVPHVHFHIVPRLPLDLSTNDEIYDRLEMSEEAMGKMQKFAKEVGVKTAIAVDPLGRGEAEGDNGGNIENAVAATSQRSLILPPELRAVRTPEEMAEEAENYRKGFAARGWRLDWR